ncbi:hypothetical protein HPB51_008008 [Rhipicephalus microplus]|uniref:Tick transposon n=1 Tax=Rhipicephalus microplus TaxID=6941 RepID=A0A9J6DG29_RHIMP|nr:hypothetical protein HPB51_008008 [Rhipicephalus microplus]
MEREHPVSAYVVASGTTSRGVVRGVDADFPDSELQRLFISSHNPMLMGVRKIKNTTTIILLFDGLKVPNYVRYGMLLLRCTLYKRHIDTSSNCGRVGHRQDVCPTPSEKVCEYCGIKPTGPDHECVTPEFALCGQAHITGDITCPNRYQVPYIVRRRRRRRRRRKHNQQTQGDSATQQPTSKQPSPIPPMKDLPTNTKNPTATPTWLIESSVKVYPQEQQLQQQQLPPLILLPPRDPATFSGTDKDKVNVEDWVTLYERVSEYYRWYPTLMLPNVVFYLRDTALSRY